MGWFSPVKGSYPSLAQIDKTLPAKTGTAITRGMIVALRTDTDGDSKEGVFDVATATDTKLLYVALSDYTDPTAGYAGDINYGRAAAYPHAFSASARPAITALALDMEGEYETSVFDADSATAYTIGAPLYVTTGGKLTATAGSSPTVVGYVTKAPADRWVNNAVATPSGTTDPRLATRTGAMQSVLRFRTK